jgi:hypothetical protein
MGISTVISIIESKTAGAWDGGINVEWNQKTRVRSLQMRLMQTKGVGKRVSSNSRTRFWKGWKSGLFSVVWMESKKPG